MPATTVPIHSTAFDSLESMGGRDRYVERMLAHYRNLAKVTSNLKKERPAACFENGTRRTPRPAHNRDFHWKVQNSEEFANVRRTQQATARAKPTVSARRSPEELALPKRLLNNRRAKSTDVSAAEHRKRLTNMVRRIESVGSIDARKKSGIDWRFNPPVELKRRTVLPPDPMLLVRQAVERGRENAKLPRPVSASNANRKGPVPAKLHATSRARPISAPSGEATSRTSKTISAPALRAASKPPSSRHSVRTSASKHALKLNANDDYSTLREKLLGAIVERRLYKEVDLRAFLTQVSRENNHLEQAQLSSLITEIKAAFFL